MTKENMTLEIIKMSFESLLAKKSRTFLSMLGVIIGVSTVIAVFAIGQGAQNTVNEQFQGLSANSILIMGNMGRGNIGSSKFALSDAKVILEEADHISQATGIIQGEATVVYASESDSLSVMGVEGAYFDISSLEIFQGRLINNEDVSGNERVVVLGSGVVETLFGEETDVIGKEIKVASKQMEVVGVLKETGRQLGMSSVDETIYAPQTTAEKSIIGGRAMKMINTTVDNVDNVELATEEITSILREQHKLKNSQEDDFRIMDAGSMVGAAQESAQLMSILLTLIAAITLLVSGIGIMNVMFVTVAERTKEIGIAKAIGGKRADILQQFLFESVILSMIGGIIGIIIGQIAIPIISNLNLMALASSITGPVIGFSFSVVVGVIFGFYPAFKASRLDPVDALRSE